MIELIITFIIGCMIGIFGMIIGIYMIALMKASNKPEYQKIVKNFEAYVEELKKKGY